MVKYAYKRLNSRIVDEETFLYDFFWKTKALTIAQHFSWRVIINKITTRDNLQHMGVKHDSRMRHVLILQWNKFTFILYL